MSVALRGARLLRPRERSVIVDAGDVVIEGGIIASIGVAPPPDAEVVLLDGLTVMPALVDVHTHATDPAALALYLQCGVTSVRVAGSAPDIVPLLRRQAAAGELVAPRLFTCGPMLDEPPGAWPEGTVELAGPEAAEAAVASVAAGGADAIILGQRIRAPTAAAIIDAAHRLGLPVTAQTWATSARDAVSIGVDGLENTARIPEDPRRASAWLESYASVADRLARLMRLWSEAPQSCLDEVLGAMVERGVDWAPEACSFALWAGSGIPDLLALPVAALMSDNERASLPGSAARQTLGWTDGDRAIAERAVDRALEAVLRFEAWGGFLAIGTDARPGGPFYHLELAMLRRAGVSNERVLAAATLGGAHALRRLDLGRLEPGAAADLIAVDGDPLTDLAALQRARGVWIGGVRVVL